jgi:pimeloyl-ACP methyl ester carboxylesterase
MIKESKTIQIADRRRLGYAEFGDPHGKPVFYFHGFPGSRLEAEVVARDAERLGLHLVSVDRPGMGLSSFQPQRRILDWPEDIRKLGDELGFERFSVIGLSGGAPYAAACAYIIGERLENCILVSGLASPELGLEGMNPTNRYLIYLVRIVPLWFLRFVLWYLGGRYRENPQGVAHLLNWYRSGSNVADLAILDDEKMGKLLIEAALEGFLQGTKGVAWDAKLIFKNWGFSVKDITFEHMYLWHGEQDDLLPVAMAKRMAAAIPHCKAHYSAGEGHLSLAYNQLEAIANEILKDEAEALKA